MRQVAYLRARSLTRWTFLLVKLKHTLQQHPQPRGREVQFREGALNRVDTPFLQATTFEHEHEHERQVRLSVAEDEVRYAGRRIQRDAEPCPKGGARL